VLYAPSSMPGERQEASTYLERFQNQLEAWNVALGVLTGAGQSSEMVLFAAQTLKHKVQFVTPVILLMIFYRL